MIPVLSTNTTLTGNGIGLLSDAITCRVTHEINGEYEFRMTYPVTGQHYGDLQVDSVIWATPDNMTAKQPFRIYRITRPLNQVVTVYARHAAYDASGVVVEPVTAASLTAALPAIAAACVPSCPLTLTTSRTVATQYKLTVPTPLWSVFGGIQGSLLDVYGGEWDFNGLTADLKTKLGADRGVDIRYGKNMTQLEQDVTVEATYAYVYPLWTDENGTLVTLPEKYITVVGAVGSRMMTLDLSDAFDTAPTEAQLRTRANKFITDNDPGTPKISWKVNMAQLSQSPEFQDMAILDQVQLGDTIRIFYEPMNLTATSRAVKTDYDVLSERYAGITLGRVKQNLASIVAASQKETDARFKTMKSMLEQAIDSATDFITNGAGYMRFIYNASNELQEIVSLDNPDIALAQSVWRWNNGGFGHSSTGYAGPYTTAITQNGAIVADFVTAGTMAGNRVRTGLLQDETNTNYWNLDTGDFHIQAVEGIQNTLAVGGRNLIVNTLEEIPIDPDTGWAYLTDVPRLINQQHYSLNNSWLCTPGIHGVRMNRTSSADTMTLRFLMGSRDHTQDYFGMQGLTAGETYTFSCDISWKILDSSSPPPKDVVMTIRLEAFYLDGTRFPDIYAWEYPVTPGSEQATHVVGTFTIPEEAEAIAIDWATMYSDHSALPPISYYPVGDWWEMDNMKLEIGDIATAWTPAPEDIIQAADRAESGAISETASQFDVLSESITATVGRMDTLENGLQEQISTTVDEKAGELDVNIRQAQSTADYSKDLLDAHFRFTGTGLKIYGTENSQSGSYVNLAADRFSMFYNNDEKLWLTTEGANAEAFNANKYVQIGDSTTGKFLWEAYSGGFRLRKA